MTAWTLHDDFLVMRARFHRALAISVGLHALLALCLLLVQGARPDVPRIVEITWLEPAVAALPAPVSEPVSPPREESTDRPATPSAPTPERVATRPRQEPADAAASGRTESAQKRREAQLAALAATRGAVSRELEVAPASAVTRQLLGGAPTGGSDLTRVAAATMMPVAERGRPAALARGPAVKGTALALNRGPAAVGGGLALAVEAANSVSREGSGDGNGTGGGSASVSRAAASPRRGFSPGDILIEGPAADRPVLDSALPAYPDWARRQAVEAAVTLRFTVLPDGRVREDVRVERTGGFSDFDERAVAALRQWRFAALQGGDAAGQWGTITFRFRLRG